MKRYIKTAIILAAIALAFRKIKERWFLAIHNPMKFSNFARIEILKSSMMSGHFHPAIAVAMAIKYSALCSEAGIKPTEKEIRRAKKRRKKKSNKHRPSHTRIRG